MKIIFRNLVQVLILLFLQVTISAQELVDSDNKENYKHSLGVGAGLTTGYGLSYRFLPNKIGVQTTFAPYNSKFEFKFNIGVTFLFRLIEAERTHLLLYQGNQYLYSKYKPLSYHIRYLEEHETSQFNNSIGLGIEFIIMRRVSFNLMGGYAAYENFDRISFTGETGLYFMF